jgi:cytidine deaminase
MDLDSLISEAKAARRNAYAPYSNFAVGAALLGRSGRVFTGCNVENISYGLTICAERSAICQAIASGERAFTHIAIASDSKTPVSPCGACRQVLAEFGTDILVVAVNLQDSRFESTLDQLLPRAREGILGS